MNWEALGAFGEIIGAIAVFATLLYLAKQIRQSNQFAIASSEIAIRNSFGPINEAIYGNTEIARLNTMAKDENAEFDDIDYVRYLAFLRRCMNAWLSIEAAYNNGMTSQETYEVIFDDIKWIIRDYPGSRFILKDLVDSYPAHSNSRLFISINESLGKYSDGNET